MIDVKLDFDESIIIKNESIRFDTSAGKKGKGDIFVSNKRLVLTREGMFGKTKETYSFPLSEIKKFNGRPQIKYNDNPGQNPTIDIYTTRMQIEVIFEQSQKKDAKMFVYQVHRNMCSEEEFAKWDAETRYFPTINPIQIAEKIGGTIGTVIDAIKPQIPGTSNCSKCGSVVHGIIGKSGRCEFCGNEQLITGQ